MPKAPSEPKGSSPVRHGLLRPANEQSGSQMPSQGDHIRMLIELLQPTGPDLARRWLAALLLVPREDRQSVVESVEDRITSMYASAAPVTAAGVSSSEDDEPREIDVVYPPVQHDGYVEEMRTTYAATDKPSADHPARAQTKTPDKRDDEITRKTGKKDGKTGKTRRTGKVG